MAARKTARDKLLEDTRRGGVSLVLGAGVSFASGVPSWPALLDRLWQKVSETTPPWRAHQAALWRAVDHLKTLEDEDGARQFPDEMLRRLCLHGPDLDALGLQMGMEAVERRVRDRLRAESKRAHGTAREPTRREIEARFAELLRHALYDGLKPDASNPTLDALASVLRREFRHPERRILRVITFNADDLLERATNRGTGRDPLGLREPVVWPIARESAHPRRAEHPYPPPIPLYHVHGFLPSRTPHGSRAHDAADALVFTDQQYWASVATPLSFANRVLANALHDGHCVFVGLSMTDLNLHRWLGTRSAELGRDKTSQYERQAGPEGPDPARLRDAHRRALERHYWITTSPEPHGVLHEHLEARGVRSVVLERGWSELPALLDACFPDAPRSDRDSASVSTGER
jgi:hypothetical protein